jgi:hypothetical protein
MVQNARSRGLVDDATFDCLGEMAATMPSTLNLEI